MYYNLQIGKRNMLFTYYHEDDIELGTYCKVEYNHKIEEGIIVQKKEQVSAKFEIKKILEILDKKLDKNLFSLMQWIHSYYLEPYGNLLPLIEEPAEQKLKEFKEKKKKIKDFELTEEQAKVYCDIKESDSKVHLINGVTGSGKTQIYIKLIKDAIKNGGGAILLVPEINLTSQLKSNLETFLGESVAIWHSKLSKKDKYKYHKLLNEGKIKVVLGARSAIFTNIQNLKYIIIDEEHETTYKQDEAPRYHVKNVAIKRALIENAKVVLGTATPSFETMYQVKQGYISQHILEKRYNGASLPSYVIKDMTEERGNISKDLLLAINDRIEKDEQVILLLNRKAYSIFIECKDCKNIVECKQCTFKLIYYKNNTLKCNQCGMVYKMLEKCEKCSSNKLEKIGIGTEKVEEQLKEIFDEELILRMDADSMTTKNKIDKAYRDFLNKKYKILIGTQILAKGFHFPDVTLVGVLNADQMLNFPDYRSYERSYQLITQAAGRAGRGDKKGEVFIQTYNKDSILIKAIVTSDYNLIYTNQMEARGKLFYPPFSKHIKILFTDINEKRLEEVTQQYYEYILNKLNLYAKIYPIAKCLVYKASKRYRLNINLIYDRKNDKKVKSVLRNILAARNKLITRILVDVDPLNML